MNVQQQLSLSFCSFSLSLSIHQLIFYPTHPLFSGVEFFYTDEHVSFPHKKRAKKAVQTNERSLPLLGFPGEKYPIFIGYTFMWEKDIGWNKFSKKFCGILQRKGGFTPSEIYGRPSLPFPENPEKERKMHTAVPGDNETDGKSAVAFSSFRFPYFRAENINLFSPETFS